MSVAEHVFQFNTGSLLIILEDGTALLDRRVPFLANPFRLSGPQVLAVHRLSATVTCDCDGVIAVTTSLWRDTTLGMCTSHTFVEVARALCGMPTR